MNRDQAFVILQKYLSNPNLIKHSLATEAAMKALCTRLNQNPTPELIEKWGVTGLLHDADYQMTGNDVRMHGLLLFQKEPDIIPDDIAYAIKAHNYQNTGIEPQSSLDWAIACCDQLTGLIVATTLVSPTKKLDGINAESVLKRFKEKSFAKGADRAIISLCEEKLGITLEEFTQIILKSMQDIAPQLGL